MIDPQGYKTKRIIKNQVYSLFSENFKENELLIKAHHKTDTKLK